MIINCAWCGQTIRETATRSNHQTSHGICSVCTQKMVDEINQGLDFFINRFQVPILVLNSNSDVIAANLAARKKMTISQTIIAGERVGNLIECINAAKEGGCGRTIHCRACTIRNSIQKTAETGEPQLKVAAFADTVHEGIEEKITFSITTEKIGDFIALKIEKKEDN